MNVTNQLKGMNYGYNKKYERCSLKFCRVKEDQEQKKTCGAISLTWNSRTGKTHQYFPGSDKVVLIRKSHEGAFCDGGNALYYDLACGYIGKQFT
jgi:hypothetical protein